MSIKTIRNSQFAIRNSQFAIMFCNEEKFVGTVSVHKTSGDLTPTQNVLPIEAGDLNPQSLLKARVGKIIDIRRVTMGTLENYQLILKTGKTTTAKALELFDTLEPVNLGFMFGRWQGSGLHTNHSMDGLLEISNWYGKEFIDSENVHPLLFLDGQEKFFQVAPNPTLMNWVLKLPIPKNNSLKPLLISINSLLKTDKSQARLRMMEYRGKVTATMIYDYLPINDSFRKVDENTVLGIMDYKNIPQPFFFILKRCL